MYTCAKLLIILYILQETAIKIIGVPAFKDNYIWLLINPRTQQCAIVDPGDATPVLEALQTHALIPTAILITHHHWDHTGGIQELLNHQTITHPEIPLPVYGSYQEPIQNMSHPLKDGEILNLKFLETSFRILAIPGHTLGHIAYYTDEKLFCGDTLFTAGCGRLFEGTAEQMFHSLSTLKQLPPSTLVYCGHEYTQSNLCFAEVVEPHNQAIIQRIGFTKMQRLQKEATVPATLEIELKTNPFLRTQDPTVKKSAETYAGHPLNTEVDIFATLRAWKNQF